MSAGPTPSATINNLIAALCDNPRPPTAEEIRSAMALAYEGGRIDGNLESLNKMLAQPDIAAATPS